MIRRNPEERPGAGQAAMRQTRGVAYIAAEAYAWVQALEFRREENRRRANYRRTAREVARAPFGAVRDTSWEYYEALEERESSGRYNLTPNGPLTPETDTSTYNGNQWLRIRELRFSNPDCDGCAGALDGPEVSPTGGPRSRPRDVPDHRVQGHRPRLAPTQSSWTR